MKLKLIIFLFLLISKISVCQNNENSDFSKSERLVLDEIELKVRYILTFQPDTLNENHKVEEPMVLLIGNNKSMFVSYWKLCSDTAFNNMQSIEDVKEYAANPSLRPPTARVQYRLFKNYPKDFFTYTRAIPPDIYKYEEPMNQLNWIIEDSIIKWKKHNIQKATTEYGGRKWEAWFTPEIPISEGPYKFHGLPGLILKIKDSKEHYVFVLDIIEAAEEGAVIEFANGIRYINTDKKGYYQAYEYFRNDIINRAKEVGIDAPDLLQNMARTMQKRNNPIELIAD